MAEDDVWLERKELVWIPVIAVIVAAPIAFAWLNSPALIFQVEATASSISFDSPTGSFFAATEAVGQSKENIGLKIRQKDVKYLNRIYKETTHEQVYCGIIQDKNTIRVWKADIVNSSKTTVWYSTSNCPRVFEFSQRARIHTQPYSLDMSETDKKTHRQGDFKYSCIQNGLMTEKDGEELESFVCYEKVGEKGTEDEFERIPVEVRKVD